MELFPFEARVLLEASVLTPTMVLHLGGGSESHILRTQLQKLSRRHPNRGRRSFRLTAAGTY